MAGQPSRMMKQTCPDCGAVTVKKTNTTKGRCDECKLRAAKKARQLWWRKNHEARPQEDDLMPYHEIAKRLGFNNSASVHSIVKRALRKLRKDMEPDEETWKTLYRPEPEGPGRPAGETWHVSDLSLHDFPLQPRRGS